MEDVDKTVIGVAVDTADSSAAKPAVRFRAADGEEIELSGAMSVGRSADCDITIDDGRVSRSHAKITVDGDQVTLEDLGSANGTFINGTRVQASQVLNSGDEVSFDSNKFTFLSGEKAVAEEVIEEAVDPNATMIGTAPPPISAEPPPPSEPKPIVEEPEKHVPGSWDDSQGVEGTQLMQAPDLPELSAALQNAAATAETNLPHLVISTASGNQIVELSVNADGSASVWEIGREQGCDILVADPSVSSRHAQLVCKNGRWRMVNMVSTNGIFVNGEKKLSAYLSDGDEVQLGAVKLLFQAGDSQVAASSASNSGSDSGSAAATGSGKKIAIGVIVIAVIAAAVVVLG